MRCEHNWNCLVEQALSDLPPDQLWSVNLIEIKHRDGISADLPPLFAKCLKVDLVREVVKALKDSRQLDFLDENRLQVNHESRVLAITRRFAVVVARSAIPIWRGSILGEALPTAGASLLCFNLYICLLARHAVSLYLKHIKSFNELALVNFNGGV